MIKLENICKSYDEKTVLDNIMAEFLDDSITCIMGESGARQDNTCKDYSRT